MAFSLFAITLSLTVGCGSAASSAAETPTGGSHANEGGEADGHPHEDGSAGVDDGHHGEHSAADPSEGPEAARDACAEIAELCHDVDGSSADAHQCHVLGHSHGGGAGCDEHLEHCRTACAAAPAAVHAGHEH